MFYLLDLCIVFFLLDITSKKSLMVTGIQRTNHFHTFLYMYMCKQNVKILHQYTRYLPIPERPSNAH